MLEVFSKIPQQFKEFWNNMDKGNRIKTIVISAAVFLSVIVMLVFFTRPQYQALFSSRLDPKDVGEISTQLEKLNIPYKLGDGGTTIQVKKQDLNKAKVSLAEAGYPKSGMTFDDLNQTKLGTTDAERRRNYQIYKESELATALKENIQNLKNARVMLSIPEQTQFFNSEKTPAKASVIIDSYQELNANQINAIQRFISGSVENLAPKDVTILDSQGNMLNDEDDGNVNTSVDKQYALKQTVTKGVEKQVKDLLSGVADNVKVMANLEFDFNKLVTNKETYEPVLDGKGIIRNHQEKKETVTNGTAAGGIPGTDTNPATYPNAEAAQNGDYKLDDVNDSYEINKTVTAEEKELGKIDKDNSSITIAMSNNQQASGTGGANAANTNIDVNKIKGMVATATGIAPERITVETLDVKAQSETKTPLDMAKAMAEYGPIALLAVLIGLIAVLIFRRRHDESVETAEQQAVPANLAMSQNMEDEDLIPDISLEEKSEVKKQIDKFVKQRPDAVAQLLRNWLSEDWE